MQQTMGSKRASFEVTGDEIPAGSKRQRSGASHDGQGLVEFALILPMFLLLVLGIVEFGRMMIMFSSVSTASRDAVRYAVSVGESASGIPHFQDCLGIRAAAQKVAVFADPSIVITRDSDGPGGAAPIEYCQVGKDVDPIEVALGNQITVTVTDIYNPLLPLVELPTIPITSETARTVLRDVYVK